MSSGRVGKAIVLTCFFTAGYGRHRKLGVGFRTAGYGRHRSQWVNRQRLMQSELRTLNGLTSRILGCLKINSMFCSTVLYFLTCHVLTNVVRVIESEII